MLYHIENVIKRLQDAGKGLVTEQELLALATPHINHADQIVGLIKKAVKNGYAGQYPIGDIATHTTIPRQTLYRWLGEGIILRDADGKIDMQVMLHSASKKIAIFRRFRQTTTIILIVDTGANCEIALPRFD